MQELIQIKMLKYFLVNPYQEVYLTELSKILKISTFATKKNAEILLREGLINDERKANLRYFKAGINSPFFKYLKIAFSIDLLLKSGLLDFLRENIPNLSSIVLFGSTAKGLDTIESDIDILIVGQKKQLNLTRFEKELGREITIHTFSWSEWNEKARTDKPFYFEVISHGIPIFGELPII